MLSLRIENLLLAGRRLTLEIGVDAWHIEGLPEGVTQCFNVAITEWTHDSAR